jgi:DeoR family fructose operon transcriptional repressor
MAARKVSAPGTSSLPANKRLTWLSERLTNDGSVTLLDAAAALRVSEMTIRRDLDELERRGTARRVRGGAQAVGPRPFAERRQIAALAKGRIAAKLAGLLPSEGAVAFDASSTVLRAAVGLEGARDLTVLTNGPETFHALQSLPGVTPLLTGGRLDERTGSLVGPLACWSAQQLTVHTFVTSAAAVDVEAGALETTLDEAAVKRAIAARAERVLLVVDASKLDTASAALSLCWDEIDLLVTDLDPSNETLAPYRNLVPVR